MKDTNIELIKSLKGCNTCKKIYSCDFIAVVTSKVIAPCLIHEGVNKIKQD